MKRMFGRLLAVVMVFVMVLGFAPQMRVYVQAEGRADRLASGVSAGSGASFAIREDGSLWAWGRNTHGQLGVGADLDIRTGHTPQQILQNAVAVSAGEGHTMAITADGTLWGWGHNNVAQLGDGTRINRNSPVPIMNNVIAVSAGSQHTMAIRSDGSLWGWGLNNRGRLGDGTTTLREIPTHIMNNVVAVSAGATHTMAITTDGTLWGWGDNNEGILGQGTSTNAHHTPVRVMHNVMAVSAADSFTAAIQFDGSLWTWGHNGSQRIGDGEGQNRRSPVRVLENVAAVAASRNNVMAIQHDGSLWAWGSQHHLLILGREPHQAHIQATPVQILEDVAEISLSSAHALAVMNDGRLMGWGSNQGGEMNSPANVMHERDPAFIMNLPLPEARPEWIWIRPDAEIPEQTPLVARAQAFLVELVEDTGTDFADIYDMMPSEALRVAGQIHGNIGQGRLEYASQIRAYQNDRLFETMLITGGAHITSQAAMLLVGKLLPSPPTPPGTLEYAYKAASGFEKLDKFIGDVSGVQNEIMQLAEDFSGAAAGIRNPSQFFSTLAFGFEGIGRDAHGTLQRVLYDTLAFNRGYIRDEATAFAFIMAYWDTRETLQSLRLARNFFRQPLGLRDYVDATARVFWTAAGSMIDSLLAGVVSAVDLTLNPGAVALNFILPDEERIQLISDFVNLPSFKDGIAEIYRIGAMLEASQHYQSWHREMRNISRNRINMLFGEE